MCTPMLTFSDSQQPQSFRPLARRQRDVRRVVPNLIRGRRRLYVRQDGVYQTIAIGASGLPATAAAAWTAIVFVMRSFSKSSFRSMNGIMWKQHSAHTTHMVCNLDSFGELGIELGALVESLQAVQLTIKYDKLGTYHLCQQLLVLMFHCRNCGKHCHGVLKLLCSKQSIRMLKSKRVPCWSKYD